MPVLNMYAGRTAKLPSKMDAEADPNSGLFSARHGMFSTCANPRCNSGWLKVWRNRTAPVFEGGWNCSPECTQAQVAWALRREMDMQGRREQPHRHRIPLGLLMLERGWISSAQLRGALAAQRAAGAGRIGYWLIHGQGVSERLVTRALGLQAACPVLETAGHAPENVTAFIPRFFLDAFGALPIRTAGSRVLYVGFEQRLDPVLALAVERMTGVRVECGLVADADFRAAHARILQAVFPRVELIEAISEQVLARELARRVERERPVESRLVRVHDCYWLRMWKRPQHGPLPDIASVQDLICSLHDHL
jgi:hypothetical protein